MIHCASVRVTILNDSLPDIQSSQAGYFSCCNLSTSDYINQDLETPRQVLSILHQQQNFFPFFPNFTSSIIGLHQIITLAICRLHSHLKAHGGSQLPLTTSPPSTQMRSQRSCAHASPRSLPPSIWQPSMQERLRFGIAPRLAARLLSRSSHL